jgi:hypothetical protein
MAFNKADKDKIGALIERMSSNYMRQPISDDEIALIESLTIGDLIVEFFTPIDVATHVVNNIRLALRQKNAPGFRVNRDLNESRRLSECGTMDSEGGGMEMQYHPVMDDHGLDFEDSNAYEEAGMIKSNLYSIAGKAQSLHDMVGDGDDLPEWVQEKIAICDEYMDVIHDYLKYEYKRGR